MGTYAILTTLLVGMITILFDKQYTKKTIIIAIALFFIGAFFLVDFLPAHLHAID